MYKITTNDNSVYKCEYLLKDVSAIWLFDAGFNEFNLQKGILFSDIKSIEKKVKDLTLEESIILDYKNNAYSYGKYVDVTKLWR